MAPSYPYNRPDRETAIDTALARSVVYRLLAQGFRLPSEGLLLELASEASRSAIEAAARLLQRLTRTEDPLHPAVLELRAFLPANAESLGSAGARLFGHARGLVCPFETEYGPEGAFHQPQQLADIAGYYLAVGLTPSSGIDERLDHVACECEFMGFLSRKEAFTLTLGAEDEAETVAVIGDVARGFLRDHLARFGRAFARLLTKEDAGGFYGALGGVLSRLLALECARLGLPVGPPTLALRPPVPDDTPMACGDGRCAVGRELIDIQGWR